MAIPRAASRRRSCSSWVWPKINTLSTIHATPGRLARTVDMRFGAEVIPNGSLLKQNCPNGVMKVVSNADSLDNLICQNLEFASNLEKTFAPQSWARICSTDGRMWCSLCTLSLSFVRSMQVLTLPSDLELLPYLHTNLSAHARVRSLQVLPSSSIRPRLYSVKGLRLFLELYEQMVWHPLVIEYDISPQVF